MRNSFFDDDVNYGEARITQESYNAASSGFSDLFQSKFTGCNPHAIVSENNRLKSGMIDMGSEDSDLALGHHNKGPATAPKPGKFF